MNDLHLNVRKYQPNLYMDFKQGKVGCNKIAESFTSSVKLNPLVDGCYLYLTYCEYYAPSYYELTDGNDEYVVLNRGEEGSKELFYNDGLDVSSLKERNTGIKIPTKFIVGNFENGLNIKIQNTLAYEIRKFIVSTFNDNIDDMDKNYNKFSNSTSYNDYIKVTGLDVVTKEKIIEEIKKNNTFFPFYTEFSIILPDGNESSFIQFGNEIVDLTCRGYNIDAYDTKIVCMPFTAKEFNKYQYNIEGLSSTIIYDILGKSNTLENCVVLCADPRILEPEYYKERTYTLLEVYLENLVTTTYNELHYNPDGEWYIEVYREKTTAIYPEIEATLPSTYRKGFFLINGVLTKYLLITPGSIVNFIPYLETLDNGEKSLIWVVMNSEQFKEVSGNEMAESRFFSEEIGYDNLITIFNNYDYIERHHYGDKEEEKLIKNRTRGVFVSKNLEISEGLEINIGITINRYNDILYEDTFNLYNINPIIRIFKK